ncbi:MAG: DUF5689 domain-containing protein [Saprospiraceae bacterium]|nr:DUF5689 domain-containing protein [Saprospiraceae bacterium]MDZ4705460.1 DUF5689 domain-containing protein [Saprospiraceae bacterium]
MAFFLKRFSVFALLISLTTWGCIDREFDEPPVGELPDLEANATIAQLKALHIVGGTSNLVTEDWIVDGVVVADDESGNFFKNIVIQDETGGIAIRLNSTGLYNDFPVGRKVFLLAKNLYIGDYNGLHQVNGSTDAALEEVLIPEHVIGAERDQTVVPKVVTMAELQNTTLYNSLVNTLIQINDVQFAQADAGATYANAVTQFSLNRNVEDCNGNSIILRSSGFADFAAELTPTGKGSIVAVVSIFGNTKQLNIRDLNDVQMAGNRCGGVGPGGDVIPINDVRNLFTAGTTAGPAGKTIKGVVISDRAAVNTDPRNIVLQDASGGIVVRFSAAHNFDLGDEVEVSVDGQDLSEFNGLLQVNNVPNNAATSTGSGTLPTPREATVAEINANLNAWESTLVKVKNATLSGGATYSGSRTLSDGTGSIILFTRSQATFSGAALPTGNVDVVALISQFNDAQLSIRSLNDVTGGGNGGDPVEISLGELRTLFAGGASSVPAAKKVKGIVISDATNFNWADRNLVIQDASGGIAVRFTAAHAIALGQEVEIIVSGAELSEFNGLLQVNNVPNGNATSLGAGTLPTPRQATIAEILTNLEAWESTLVKIINVTITGGGTYSGAKSLNDGTGTMDMFTRSQATFSGTSVPAGAVTIVAVVSQFNVGQVIIRNTSDVTP